MTRVLAFVFSAALLALMLAPEASARRGGGGIGAGAVGAGVSTRAFRAGPLVQGYRGYSTAGWWSGWPWWLGAGLAATTPGYYYGPRVYGWTSTAGTKAEAAEQPARSPGMCGTNFYWKGGRCVDARLK